MNVALPTGIRPDQTGRRGPAGQTSSRGIKTKELLSGGDEGATGRRALSALPAWGGRGEGSARKTSVPFNIQTHPEFEKNRYGASVIRTGNITVAPRNNFFINFLI